MSGHVLRFVRLSRFLGLEQRVAHTSPVGYYPPAGDVAEAIVFPLWPWETASDISWERALRRADPRVFAVRTDALVGRGSCTSTDEAWEDAELIEAMDLAGVVGAEAAVRWAREGEGLWLEQGTNASSGEPDCPLVRAHTEWEERYSHRDETEE